VPIIARKFLSSFFVCLVEGVGAVNPTRPMPGNLDYFNCIDLEDPGDIIKGVSFS
jgi:hypothetical protein